MRMIDSARAELRDIAETAAELRALLGEAREWAHDLRTWPVTWGEEEGPTDLDVAVMQRTAGAIFKAGHRARDVIEGAALHVGYGSTRLALRLDRITAGVMERRTVERQARIAAAVAQYRAAVEETAR